MHLNSGVRRTGKHMSKSIAFLKFKSTIELEIRAFWHTLAAIELSERTVRSYTQPLITDEPGNAGYPFKAISITPRAFIDEGDSVAGFVRENSLVSFVTTFEAYLLELMERMIYLNPEAISDSEMQMAAKDIVAAATSSDSKQWLARKVAEKYLRNKTHIQMIKKIDKISLAGTSSSRAADIEDWHKWTLVRNSIVHTTRQITHELSEKWPEKFPTPGRPFSLTNHDVSKVFSLAIDLAGTIDKAAVARVIKKADALALAKEIYVHLGVSNPGELRKKISSCGMRTKLTNEDLERMLSRHKRGDGLDTLSLSSIEMQRVFA